MKQERCVTNKFN